MGAPSNLIVNPSSIVESSLPTNISISGTDIFERPSYTGRELFDVVDSRWKNGATQGQGIIGESIVLDGVNDYFVDSFTGSVTNFIGVSFWIKPDNVSIVTTLFDITDVNPPSQSPYDRTLYIRQEGANIRCMTHGVGTALKKDFYVTGVLSLGVWTNVIIYLDVSTPTNMHRVFVDGIEQTINTTQNSTFSAIVPSDTYYIGATDVPSEYVDGSICGFYYSTNSDFANHVLKYSNIPSVSLQYVGNITNQVTFTSESQIDYTAPNTLPVGVVNGAVENSTGSGAFNFSITAQAVKPAYTLTNTFDASTFDFEYIEEGFESVIDLPFTNEVLSDGNVEIWDDGADYDKYSCRFTAVLTEASYNSLIAVYNASRDSDFTLTPNATGGGFCPFTPAYGDEGVFTFKIKSLTQSGTLDEERYQWFRVAFEIINSGSLPSYTPQVGNNEGNLQIGTIGGLRYPIGGYQPSVEFVVGGVSTSKTSAYVQDWQTKAIKTKFKLRLLHDKMSLLIKHLLSERTNQISILVPSGHFPYGADRGDNASFVSRLISQRLVVKQIKNKRYEISLEFSKVV